MWFKLNTTFTQSLGTLDSLSNSWSITRNLTNFSTSSTVTSVTKNSSYSATFTLNSGCTYSSHSVTMGGAAVTSGVSYSNGTLTVNISKVTGAVVITAVATGASSGGGTTPTPPSGGDTGTDRTYTIGKALKFDDMSEVAATFVEGSYYVSDNGSPAKLSISVRDGYKAWKNIKVYAGQSYALNPDARAIVIYDDNDMVLAAFNLKNTYSDGIIPASVITQDAWMSCTVTSSTSNDSCTITRVS